MDPYEVTEVLNRPLSKELLDRFETTLPSAVEELIQQQQERQFA